MKPSDTQIDDYLGRSLLEEGPTWPVAWTDPRCGDKILSRIRYHGLASLLSSRNVESRGWPPSIVEALGEMRIERAKWELRHQNLLAMVFREFATRSLSAAVIKGTALAYQTYPNAHLRERGDTDILVPVAQVGVAREGLRGAGFTRDSSAPPEDDPFAYQEIWSWSDGSGIDHDIDLHWKLLNSPSLGPLVSPDEPFPLEPLEQLTPGATTLPRHLLLAHACIHRAMHITTPYFVGDCIYYGGDRLIWLWDILLLDQSMSEFEWEQFAALIAKGGYVRVCRQTFDTARQRFGYSLKESRRALMQETDVERPSEYLLDRGQVARAWLDLLSIHGFGAKLRFIAGRLVPSPDFMRAKYPAKRDFPIWRLHFIRLAGWLRPRRRSSS